MFRSAKSLYGHISPQVGEKLPQRPLICGFRKFIAIYNIKILTHYQVVFFNIVHANFKIAVITAVG